MCMPASASTRCEKSTVVCAEDGRDGILKPCQISGVNEPTRNQMLGYDTSVD